MPIVSGQRKGSEVCAEELFESTGLSERVCRLMAMVGGGYPTREVTG